MLNINKKPVQSNCNHLGGVITITISYNGGDGGIRTLAPFSQPKPLAGAPL